MKTHKMSSLLSGLLILFVLYDILALSTYNNDWEAYEQMYFGIFESRDYFFQSLIVFANNIGLSYTQFYSILLTFICSICILFCYKIVHKGFFLLLCVLLVVSSPNLPILIRYYLAFSLFLLSNIAYIRGYKILTSILMLLAFLTHSAIIICFPLYGLVWYVSKQGFDRLYKKISFLSIIVCVAKFAIFNFLAYLGLNVFSSYTDDIASVSSTIYMDSIYFSWFCGSYYVHSKVCKRTLCYNQDKTYLFLYSSVLYPILFVFISNIMIIQFRLYEPFVIFSLIYMLYASNKYLRSLTWVIYLIVSLLFFSFMMKFIVLGALTGGTSEWFIHYSEILLSNDRSFILKLL